MTRRFSFFPESATADARVLVMSRAVRAFGDGFVSVLLAVWLKELGFPSWQVGAITTTTLVGSAALTMGIGLLAWRWPRQRLLLGAGLLMALTGLGFTFVHAFWPLVLVAFVGTLNPSSGDVSVFLPLEQSLLPQTVADSERTALFARYGFVATMSAACGALFAAVPGIVAERSALTLKQALMGMFGLYTLLALAAMLLYRRLSTAIEPGEAQPSAPLTESKGVVYRLAALFSIDSFGSGFVVQSLLALWLFERFDISVAAVGTIFFWTGLFSAGSYFIAVQVARRIGLINTMVFSHLPANLFLMLTPLMPTLPLAIGLLLLRSLLSQMDVPTRNSYVMAVVTPAERPAAASVTAVPRSLATATSPLISGWLLGLTTFGWPLIIGGGFKIVYDLLLLRMFRSVRPPEERERSVNESRPGG
jgi:MFS family permease